MDYTPTKTRSGWTVGGRTFASLDDAIDAAERMQARAGRMFQRSDAAASLFAGGRKALGSRIPRAVLGNLRGVVSPVKTPIAGPVTVHAGAGTLASNLTVQNVIPAGAVLFVENLAVGERLDLVEIDGKNIFTGGPIPASAVNPAIVNTEAAPGLLIPIQINQQIRVTTTVAGAKTVSAYLVAPSLEVEAALDACDCD